MNSVPYQPRGNKVKIGAFVLTQTPHFFIFSFAGMSGVLSFIGCMSYCYGRIQQW